MFIFPIWLCALDGSLCENEGDHRNLKTVVATKAAPNDVKHRGKYADKGGTFYADKVHSEIPLLFSQGVRLTQYIVLCVYLSVQYTLKYNAWHH